MNDIFLSFSVLLQMAKTNGKSLTAQDENKMRVILGELALHSDTSENKLTFFDMFRHGQAVKSLIICFSWIVTCVSYYAIGLNSSDLNGNIITNYMLSKVHFT